MASPAATHATGPLAHGLVDDPVAAAHTVAVLAAARAADGERDRRLSSEVVDAITGAGLHRLLVPADVGGLEATPAQWVGAVEALATGDGAAGWCLAVTGTSGMLSAYLPLETGREIHGRPEAIVAGVVAPRGRARVRTDGYEVSGRWPFASAVAHADWLMGGCLVEEAGGELRRQAGGAPDVRLMIVPAAEAEVIDTWTVAGLRGTGSHDIRIADRFVPARRSASLLTDRPRTDRPLFAFPAFGTLALSIGAVGLGIARGAIGDLVELAAAKTPSGSTRTLGERADTQAKVARAEAMLGAARALVGEAIGTAWEAAQAEGAITVEHRAGLRRAATHAIDSAVEVVDAMYRLGGGSVIYESSPLQRRLRDVHVATQHMLVAPATWELTGRLLLGQPTDTTQL